MSKRERKPFKWGRWVWIGDIRVRLVTLGRKPRRA